MKNTIVITFAVVSMLVCGFNFTFLYSVEKRLYTTQKKVYTLQKRMKNIQFFLGEEYGKRWVGYQAAMEGFRKEKIEEKEESPSPQS